MVAISKEPLPDLLRENLDLVFVGTAAGRRSAAVSAYYAHPGNRFWVTLAETGLTPRLYQPHEYPKLLDLGIGFTDMSKSALGMDHEISPEAWNVDLFECKMRHFRPRLIAFTSKKAASVWLGLPTGRISLGHQENRADFPEIFVLASPSGAAIRYWDDVPWRRLANYVSRDKKI